MRQKKLILLIFCFFSAILLFQPNAFAQRIDEASYRYPYKNPYLATLTVAIMQGSENPPMSEIKNLRLKVLDHRDDIYLLEGMGTLRYSFYQQKGAAPLIFIIPGLAGSAYSGSARFLAEWLGGNGFHVIVLPSPFNWNFTLAANASGYPGYTQQDTQDLYSAMRLALNDVQTRCYAKISNIGVLGLSDGALYTAYLSKMDSEKKQIGIDTYLLVNPPVDLFDAARKIDTMADAGNNFGTDQKNYLEAYATGVQAEALNHNINDPDYFANWNQRLRLEDKQSEYLIGKNVHESIGDAIYVADLANNAAILTPPINWWHRNNRLEEARSYGLMRYAEKFLIPRLKRTDNKEIDLKALNDLNSIKNIKSVLENNQSVFLMHNLDDILVSEEDVTYLEKVFGKRAMVYPRGGHLGNLWYPDNKKHILDVFNPLLRGLAQSTPNETVKVLSKSD